MQPTTTNNRHPIVMLLLGSSQRGSCIAALVLTRATLSVSFTTKSTLHRFSNRSVSTTASASMTAEKSMVVDPFCFRQFRENKEASEAYSGTIFDISVSEFEKIVNEKFEAQNLADGYAPFCKHFFVENSFTCATPNVLAITPDNEHLLRSKYEARNEKELPVLARFFPQELVESTANKPAAYLDLILYSREQINKENDAQGRDANPETAPWGIVSIKAQDVPHELPMNPITVMRNSLGKAEGGSGVPLNREAYMESVNYWKDHAIIS